MSAESEQVSPAGAVHVSELMRAVREAFGSDAALAQSVPGFRQREGQLALAESICHSIDEQTPLVAEAGTGTGKTFAYLVPALLANRRVLISTGTKTLQDQLYHRDLPAVLGALGVGLKAALLKGRSNYVCRYHLARSLADGRFARRQDVAVLHRIDRFSAISRTGDRAEAPGIAEDAPAWAHATSTRDNCLGQDCEHLEECFVLHARKRALQADVVVINHHLFCADLALRDDGVSELLPKADLLIFDEAHQLPETATQFFGQTVSTRQFVEFAREIARSGRADAPDGADWIELSGAIEQHLRELRLAAGRVRRIDESELKSAGMKPFLAALDALLASLKEPVESLQSNAERSRDLERLALRGQSLIYSVRIWLAVIRDTALPDKPPPESVEPLPLDSAWEEQSDAVKGNESADGVGQAAEGTTERDDDDEDRKGPAIHWVDVHKQGLSLHRTPLSVSGPFRRLRLERPGSWIFTSATLSVGRRFDHFVNALGLQDAVCERHDSPFDFASQAMLYVPADLPDPRHETFADRLGAAILPLVEANGGRAFILCTSLRMVEAMAALFERSLKTNRTEKSDTEASAWDDDSCYELLVQGSDSRDVLLNRFREANQPILIGSASFWEGVDVVGAQLSLVVIDKLPFAPPDDPVVAARARQLKQAGQQPFMQLHLPHAAMALKQGAGRLIRSEQDRGLLVIGDTRLAEKPYGRRLVASLPPFKRTRSADEALAFLRGESPT